MFIIDLPTGPDGRRRQMFRRGLHERSQASKQERLAKQQFGRTDLAADGTVAAELMQWLGEREIDIAVTTLANRRNAVVKYVVLFLGDEYSHGRRRFTTTYRTGAGAGHTTSDRRKPRRNIRQPRAGTM